MKIVAQHVRCSNSARYTLIEQYCCPHRRMLVQLNSAGSLLVVRQDIMQLLSYCMSHSVIAAYVQFDVQGYRPNYIDAYTSARTQHGNLK